MFNDQEPAMPKAAVPVGAVEDWASLGDLERIRLAIQDGADVNAISKGNHTALHAAATNGHVEVAKLLLRNGADRAAILVSGESASDLAKLAGYDDLAKLLAG